MHTLQELQNGELKGTKQLKLSCGLTEFPSEIFELADTLELLDLSGNQLTSLPPNFGRFSKLKIAFFSDNAFTTFPSVLAECAQLEMIGFKANQILTIEEDAFPKQLRWLILTNNCITKIPSSIGKCIRLQKVGFAGNQLTALPSEMANCTNLELLRISANHIQVLPTWLVSLPKLSWLAFDANPCSFKITTHRVLPEVDWKDVTFEQLLGEGASGFIYKALVYHKEVAIKIFKGDVTSDGLPISEINACIEAGNHEYLVKTLSQLKNHPDKKQGLLFELIPAGYKNLGMPPSFTTCTRDTFKEDALYTLAQIKEIALGAAKAMCHLHQKGMMHGDLYAHNILVNDEAHCLLGDYGAATFYDQQSAIATNLEKLDVRAFGCLLDDLLGIKKADNYDNYQLSKLTDLKERCFNTNVLMRPNFKLICNELQSV